MRMIRPNELMVESAKISSSLLALSAQFGAPSKQATSHLIGMRVTLIRPIRALALDAQSRQIVEIDTHEAMDITGRTNDSMGLLVAIWKDKIVLVFWDHLEAALGATRLTPKKRQSPIVIDADADTR